MPEYQSLYRKYRSQTFGDLVGQDAASRALQGAIISARVAHAYLFSGSRGTGKTSAARLLAKALNCSGRRRDSAEPCNKCQSCVEMTAGPALGPFKIYIIDEAHMLTEPAFNALLKTLEEPPAHVVFVLCTTDAQKIPLTVIGRCQQFVFRRHGEEQIVARLTHIASTEKVLVDPEAMQLIARTAQGSMRDAVGLLDQLVPLASGPISLEGARSLLGIADPRMLDELLDHVLEGRAAEALAELNRIYSAGAELRQVVRGLMEGCRDRLVAALTRHDGATARRLSAVLDAQPEVDGTTLVLWFRYGFHHKKAQDQSAQLLPLVRAWLGDQVTVEFKLREAQAETSKPGAKGPASPEDDPFVREVVRRFD